MTDTLLEWKKPKYGLKLIDVCVQSVSRAFLKMQVAINYAQ